MMSGTGKSLAILAVSLLALAGVIYYYSSIRIPLEVKLAREEVRRQLDETAMPKRSVAVVSARDGIKRDTVLDDSVLKDCVTVMEIPEKYVVKGAVSDISELKGKLAIEDLRYGEQIAEGSLSADESGFGEYQRLKEYQVYGTVAGEVKAGNIVDIVVSYGDGSYDVVVPKTKVVKLIPGYGGGSGSQGENKEPSGSNAAVLVIAVDEEQYRDLELAQKLGRLVTRLYIDAGQPPSIKTFNHEQAAKSLRGAS